jgi:uncharacterized membrane protein YukC
MSSFKSKFNYILEADVTPAPEESPVVPASDKEAMAQQLDTAKPADFDVKAAERQTRVDHVKINQINTLNEWITQIDAFVLFLNDTNSDSIQIQLHSAPCDSMFENIARSEKKRISRLAADLGTLGQNFKGYLASAND